MFNTIGATWLLLIPFGLMLAFCVWALWSFSDELRAGKRRRVHRALHDPYVRVYWPTVRIARFRRSRDKEAA
jgi:hypothetical protein